MIVYQRDETQEIGLIVWLFFEKSWIEILSQNSVSSVL